MIDAVSSKLIDLLTQTGVFKLKRNLNSIATTATSLLLICAGCAQTQTVRIKVVDGSIRQPLSDVNVRWREDSSYNLLTGRQRKNGPVTLISNKSGMIEVEAHKEWQSRFIFFVAGKPTLHAIWSKTPETLSVGSGIAAAPVSSEMFVIEESSRTEVRITNGCFTVALPE